MTYPLSYSRANTFDECPAKFKAQYLGGRRREQDESYLIVGNMLHDLCDRYVQHLMKSLQQSDFNEFDRLFEVCWTDAVRRGLPETARSDVYSLALVARDSLIFENIRRVHAAEMKLAVDKDWKPIDYDSPLAHVRGKVDRIDIDEEGAVLIVDYKSGYRITGIKDSYQVKLYARLMLAHMPELKTIKVALDYFRHKARRSDDLTIEDMESAKDWIEAVGRGIERAAAEKHYPARPGAACRGCAIFNTCPARSESVKAIPPADEGRAVALVARLILIDRERREIMEAITPWIDQYGDVEVNGMVLGYQKRTALEFDVARVAEILERRGLRPLRYMQVDANEIRKLGRMDQKLAAELEKSARDGSSTQLKLVVQGEDQ